MDAEQQQRFAEAVERKKAEALARSQQRGGAGAEGDSPVHEEVERSLIEPGRPADTLSPREKSQQKGKVTADKWNQ